MSYRYDEMAYPYDDEPVPAAELVRASDALAEAIAVYLEPLDDFETAAGHPLTSLRERLSGYWAVRRACPEGRTPHTEEWAGDTMYACGCLLLIDGSPDADAS